ncbi:hypothetical protein [Acinetobacter thermotolerans]|uniref:hypothetical protein n=1 Tax=Acinetobacter thermotolerans TaxID=3151487 RepID=UPI00325A9507
MLEYLLSSGNFNVWCANNFLILLIVHFLLISTIGRFSKKICSFFILIVAVVLIVRAWFNFELLEFSIQALFTILMIFVINSIDYSGLSKWIIIGSATIITTFFIYQWYVWNIEVFKCRDPLCNPKEKVICTTSIERDKEGFALRYVKEICLTEDTGQLWSFSHRREATASPTFAEGYEYPSDQCYSPDNQSVDCEMQFGLSQYLVEK